MGLLPKKTKINSLAKPNRLSIEPDAKNFKRFQYNLLNKTMYFQLKPNMKTIRYSRVFISFANSGHKRVKRGVIPNRAKI